MKILIVYENIPESTDLFLCEIEEHSQIHYDLIESHKNYVNSVDNEDLDKTLMRVYYRLHGLSENEPEDEVDWCGLDHKEIGKYLNSKLDWKYPIDIKSLDVDQVIITGFIC